MTKEKLIYLAVAVISGVFFILYRDMLALVLFLVILSIPVLLFVLAAVSVSEFASVWKPIERFIPVRIRQR